MSDDDDDDITLENLDAANILITVLNILLVFVIIIGNSLTVKAITRFRHLMYPSNIMIASLSLADLLMGIAYTPLKLMRAHAPRLLTRRPICLTFMFVSHFFSLLAIVFLSTLSIERFYAVQFPFHYHAHITIRACVFNNVIMCMCLFVLCVPMFTGADQWYDGAECYAPTLYPSSYSNILIAATFLSMSIGLLCFLRVAAIELSFRRRVVRIRRTQDLNLTRHHVRDILRMRESSMNSPTEDTINEIEIREQNSIKTKLVLTAYACSMCLWTPHVIMYLWDSVNRQHQNDYVFRVVSLLDLSSSAVNCFLYGWKNSKFRDAYLQLMGLKKVQIEPSVTFVT